MKRLWDHRMGEMVLSFHLLGKQTPDNQRQKLKRQQPVSNNSDSREHLTVSLLQGAPFTSHGTVPRRRHSHAFKVNGASRKLQRHCCGFSDPGIISQNSQNPGWKILQYSQVKSGEQRSQEVIAHRRKSQAWDFQSRAFDSFPAHGLRAVGTVSSNVVPPRLCTALSPSASQVVSFKF